MKTAGSTPRVNSGEVIAVIRRILRENGREYIGSYAIAAVCLLSIAGATAYLAWIIRDVVDEIFYKERADIIYLLTGSIFLAFVLRGLATYAQAVLLAKIGNNIVARYQARIFDHLMKLGMDFFDDQRSGRLAARINENVRGVRDVLNIALTSIARDAVTLVALVAVMAYQDPYLALFTLVIGPPLALAVNYLMKRVRAVTRQAVEINSRVTGAMQEATQGIAVVKAFTMEEQLRERMAKMITYAEDRANKITRVSERTAPIAEILGGLAVACAIGYAGFRTSNDGTLPGSVVSFITALLLAYDPARRLARVQVGLEKALVNARMIYEILDIEPKQGDKPGAKRLQVTGGAVRFEDVHFSYAEEQPVLNGFDLIAEAGKTTAIVGSSGAGKTTLFALLQRFYDVGEGRILIDDKNIADVTKASLRRSVAYVSQHPYLFEGTIGDNIRFGRADATDEEMREAARLANAEEFILAQAEGYDTPVGENGVTLSGGQRQRISIARAIVRNASVLLLDEATSALDTESEKKVQQALLTIAKGRTTLVVAHRLSTVINADKIVVMRDGKVVEKGTHKQLMVRKSGVYRRFYELQGATDLQLENDLAEAAPVAAERSKRRSR